MQTRRVHLYPAFVVAMKPSPRTRHCELLLLCARIGYSPHNPA